VVIDGDTMQVDGLMRIDEVNRELGLDLPEDDDYDTIAGFVLHQLRRVPEEGDKLTYRGLELTVQDMKGPKIETLRVKKG